MNKSAASTARVAVLKKEVVGSIRSQHKTVAAGTFFEQGGGGKKCKM